MESLKINKFNQEKKLPSNIDAEQALLGSVLVNNDILDEVANIINFKEFYDPIHSKIYEMIEKLHNKGMIVDQKFTLISSINWGSGGGALNREIGIIIESEDIAEYYREIFWDDWNGRDIDEEDTVTDGEEVAEENEEDDGFLGMPSISFVLTTTTLALISRNLFNRNRLR